MAQNEHDPDYDIATETETEVIVRRADESHAYHFSRMGPVLFFDHFVQHGETYKMPDVPEEVLEMLRDVGYRAIELEI